MKLFKSYVSHILTFTGLMLFTNCGPQEQNANEKITSSSPPANVTQPLNEKPALKYAPANDTLGSDVIVKPEVQPEFPGGIQEFSRLVNKEIMYPAIARDNGIEGTVYVAFVIDKTGTMQNVQVKKGVHPALDQEAVRVVSKFSQWKPGMNSGKPVGVKLVIPIKFKLQ